MPKPRRTHLREELIAAAETVVMKDGVQALRARAVAEAAGCALGAIYTVFPDLDALILALKVRVLDRLDAHLHARLGGTRPDDAGGGIGLLLAMADAYLDFAWNDRRRWQALFHPHLAAGTAIPDWYKARLAAIFSHLDGPLRAMLPALSAAESLRLAHTLFAAVHGIVVLGIGQTLSPVSRDGIAAEIDMLIRGAIAGVRAAPDLARIGDGMAGP